LTVNDADDRMGEGRGVSQMQTKADKAEGVKHCQILAYILYVSA